MLSHLRQLASESLIYGLSGVLARFISFFLVPVYTRLFTPEDYGVISLVSTSMALVTIFVVLALDSASARWFWDTEDTADRKGTIASWAWCQIGVSLMLGAVIYLLSDQLAATIVQRSDAALYFRLAAFTLPLSALGAVVTNWLRFQRRPWTTMIFSLGIALFSIGATLALVVGFHWRLAGVYAAQLLTAVVSATAAACILRDWIHPRHFRLARLRPMLRYALPLIPTAIAFWVMNVSDRYFVQYYSTTGEVGLYQVANSIAMIVALLTSAFQQAWGPFAMSIHKRAEANAVYANVFLAYVWLASLVGTGLAILAPEATQIVATERYTAASGLVSYLAFSNIMLGLYYIAAVGPYLAKDTRPVGVAFTLGALTKIGLSFLLVPTMGKEGAAISTLLAFSVMPVYLFWRSERVYPIAYRYFPAAAIFGLSFVLIFFTRDWQPASLVASVAVKLVLLTLFIPAAFLFRLVTVEQVRRLYRNRWAVGATR